MSDRRLELLRRRVAQGESAAPLVAAKRQAGLVTTNQVLLAAFLGLDVAREIEPRPRWEVTAPGVGGLHGQFTATEWELYDVLDIDRGHQWAHALSKLVGLAYAKVGGRLPGWVLVCAAARAGRELLAACNLCHGNPGVTALTFCDDHLRISIALDAVEIFVSRPIQETAGWCAPNRFGVENHGPTWFAYQLLSAVGSVLPMWNVIANGVANSLAGAAMLVGPEVVRAAVAKEILYGRPKLYELLTE